MTLPESFAELETWYDDLRRKHSGPNLIRALESRIEHESDEDRLRILNIFLAREHIAQGNQAAADSIRRSDPLTQVYHWHEEWREANPESDIIPILKSRLRHESHPTKRLALHDLLADAYRDKGDFASATAVCLDHHSERPTAPMPLISLAQQKFFEEEQPLEAMRIIERAV